MSGVWDTYGRIQESDFGGTPRICIFTPGCEFSVCPLFAVVRFAYGPAHDGGASLEIGMCRRILLGLTADHYTASQYVITSNFYADC